MADNKSIATRDSYGAALLELADAGHDDIVVFDADLSASTRTSVFAKKYSERFFDCGIAECNMVGVAAGMSTFGYVPFVSSFAMFAAGRAFEQIRNSIGYPELNVKIAATHGGLSVGEDGASHQCCEDFALMRTIPGMVVICPSDDLEARAAVRAAYAHKGPVYLRFSRLATPSLHDANNYTFEIGKGEVLCDGFDLAIISTGLMTSEALKAAVTLKRQDAISVRVINMPTIKPLDEEIVLRAARECHKIITVEEHSVIGGLGEQHLDVVKAKLKNKFGVEIGLEAPRIAYRESIRKACQKQGRHKKQTGGHGQFGDVIINFEPCDSEQVVFEEKVFGGSVPKNFFPAVEKGVRLAAEKGVLAGYPVVGLKATLLDGSYHPVDSSEMAFIMAAKLAYKAAMPEAGPVILEPIHTLKAHVPNDNTGDIMGDVTKRRGRVLGMEPDEDGLQTIIAEVPLAELANFTTFIRQTTQGRGWFTTEFARYEILPEMLVPAVVEQAKKLGNLDEGAED